MFHDGGGGVSVMWHKIEKIWALSLKRNLQKKSNFLAKESKFFIVCLTIEGQLSMWVIFVIFAFICYFNILAKLFNYFVDVESWKYFVKVQISFLRDLIPLLRFGVWVVNMIFFYIVPRIKNIMYTPNTSLKEAVKECW